ncbi:tRNA (guanosine(46)-N7)-methyltransferase TrmB [Thiococcus pfennigii]|nr:tRNA (guanosine(46)-N7)-methyltransferase TrmB [Thiococcus pfennigii]
MDERNDARSTETGATSDATTERQRPVRSFVLREGRLTAAQERAFATLWPRFGIDWQPGRPLDLPAAFGNDRPVVLEIGFGNGESLATMAEQAPGRNFLGIEVHRPGVGHLLLEIERRGLTNLRLLRHDAVEVLARGLAPASLAGVQLFFPDPWPKTRHHKRRILTPAFVERLARVIAPGGTLHCATDWEPYAEQMLEILSASEPFENTAGPGRYAERPPTRPLTRFEQRGQRLGHPVRDLIFRRR